MQSDVVEAKSIVEAVQIKTPREMHACSKSEKCCKWFQILLGEKLEVRTQCLSIRDTNQQVGKTTIVSVYVDEILIATNDMQEIAKIKK